MATGDALSGGPVRRALRHVWRVIFEPPASQFDSLNGLRGFSAFLVVCFHAAIFSGNFPLVRKAELDWFHRSINGFWVGLDVFFVLSGFLIGRILMTSLLRTGTVEFWSFFTRRSLRIFPAYYFVVTLAVFWYTRYEIGTVGFFYRGADWSAVLASSWTNYTYTVNYFFTPGSPNAMSWAWSLCVEEHFYLLLPLLLTLIFRTRRRGLRPALLIGITAVPFLTRAVQYALDPTIVLMDGFYYRSHNRFDEVLIGVLVAYFYVEHHAAFRGVVERLGAWTWGIGLGLIGSVWAFGGLQEGGLFAIVFQFHVMALGAAFLIVNGLFLQNRVTRFFSHPFWYPFARVSYGTYLLHPYVLFWVVTMYLGFARPDQMNVPQFLLLFSVVMTLTVILAALMFLLLEHPLIEWGARMSKRFARPVLGPARMAWAGKEPRSA